MARTKTSKPLKKLTAPKEDPDAYQKVCEEIVAMRGDNSPRKLKKLVDFKKDPMLQELGYTEAEIEEHLKSVYLETLRDLKMPAAYIIKKIAEIETRSERDRLRNEANGIPDQITKLEIEKIKAMADLVRTLDKVGFKKKSEVDVHHYFHDEVDGVLEGDWTVVHEAETEVKDEGAKTEDE